MVKTKKEINKLAKEKFPDPPPYNAVGHAALLNPSETDRQLYITGYTEAQKEMMKYKKAFDILNCYFDSISDEEQPKVAKKLEKLGV